MSTSDAYAGRYMVMVGDTMKRLFPRLQQRYPWLVGRFFIGSFSGSPDDMWIYFYPDTTQRRSQCVTSEVEADIRAITCEELIASGYPSPSLGSLKIEYPSQEEVDAAGGSYEFFR